MDGYRSGWTDPQESDSLPSYFIDHFAGTREADFGFTNPVPEEGDLETLEERMLELIPLEDRSLGEIDVPLTSHWIQKQVLERLLPIGGSQDGLQWAEPEESDPDRIKSIVNSTNYFKIEVGAGKSFYL